MHIDVLICLHNPLKYESIDGCEFMSHSIYIFFTYFYGYCVWSAELSSAERYWSWSHSHRLYQMMMVFYIDRCLLGWGCADTADRSESMYWTDHECSDCRCFGRPNMTRLGLAWVGWVARDGCRVGELSVCGFRVSFFFSAHCCTYSLAD
jgi:hypothetical protein